MFTDREKLSKEKFLGYTNEQRDPKPYLLNAGIVFY